MKTKIITITGYKGGVAKSTTAIHLADFLSEFGSTLIVDNDRNRTALSRYRANKESDREHFKFVAVSQNEAMKYVRDFEFIIFDTPARPKTEDLKELAQGCDLLILPTQPNIDSFQPMLQTALDLKEAPYKFLITLVPPYPNKSGAIAYRELTEEKLPVFKQMIRYSVGYQHAANEKTTVRYLSKFKYFWDDYKQVGKEILEFFGE